MLSRLFARCFYPPVAICVPDPSCQALILYEDIDNSKVQVAQLNFLIGALHSLRNLKADQYDTLVKRVAQHAAKLLKKVDQSRMVCLTGHLFWKSGEGSGEVGCFDSL